MLLNIAASGAFSSLQSRLYPEWTIARCNEVMHVLKKDRDLAAELAALPELAESWRKTLEKRVTTGKSPNPTARLVGGNRR